jgi:titin
VDNGTNDTIGGTTVAARNVISGNTNDGVLVTNASSTVQGNYIGLIIAGSAGVGNVNGVEVGVNNAIIGGATASARNVISGNSKDGVLIDSKISGVSVMGNYIGTDSTGTKAVGNSVGVELTATGNTVGGTAAGARNVISGNAVDGVLIDSGVSGVTVQGNFIGLNASGTAAVGNSIGIAVEGSNNTLGGTSFSARNYISGNTGDGVLIDLGVTGVTLQGNLIGTDFSGGKAVANSTGLELAGGSNIVGGTVSGAFNVISGNKIDGVLIDATSSGNLVQGDYLGIDLTGGKALGNSNGIEILSSNNTLGGSLFAARNYIAANTNDGVLLDSGAGANQILGNTKSWATSWVSAPPARSRWPTVMASRWSVPATPSVAPLPPVTTSSPPTAMTECWWTALPPAIKCLAITSARTSAAPPR